MGKFYFKTYCLSLTFVFAITFGFSQKNSNFNFYSDSLAGFNETAVRVQLIAEGVDTYDLDGLVYWKKRAFINQKFYANSNSTYKVITQNNFINAAPCVNEGFESSVLSPWLGSRGTNSSSCSYPVTSTTIGLGAPFLQINTTPFVDPIIGSVPNSPFSGNKVLKLNDGANNNPFFSVVKATQTFSVTQTNFLYEFAYIMINGGAPTNNHVCCDMPYMYVRIRDALGILQSCPNFSILPPATNSAACVGIGPTSWSSINIGPNNYVYNNGWQKYSIDLTNYMNSNVTVEVIVSDCSGGAHFGYAYYDSNCNDFGITLNSSTVFSAPTQTVNVPAPCATTATLTAPNGLSPYLWNGPAASAVTNNTNQTISTSVPGDYTLQMTPIGVCNPITRIVRLSFVPPLGVSASPTSICSAGSNTTAILTATGATSYTWSTSSNSSTISVSPLATTVYTVTGNTTTCTTSQTIQVTVNPSPTVSANTSTNVVCSGGGATLTAAGASSYTWFPGSIVGTSISVTPTTSITYTVLGDNGGCPGTATVAISVVSSPTVSAFSIPGTVCAGSNANLIAGGALNYTWQPGNLVGSNVVVTPTSTTIYTVSGSLLSCSDTETVQVSISNGPTLSIVANPTVLCSTGGGNATLTASGAVSYTWNPGAIISPAIVISPTATTIYTVTGSNSLTCLTTNTISFSVTPTPTLNVASTATAICAGGSATLTSSGATTYNWNPGSLSGGTIVVTPTTNTTYTVIGANGSCTSSLTISLVVNSNPTVTASSSPTLLCSGNNATLSALGALTFTWNPGNLNGGNVTVTPALTTQYTVTGSNATGCTHTAVASVSVNITPTINPIASPTAICIGSTATLSTGGATTYTWNPGNLSGSSVTVSPIATTIYTVTGSNGNCSDTKTVSLLVNPIPTVSAVSNPTLICSGNTATLTANGAVSYTWNPGSLTGSSVSVSPLLNTTYTVIGSNGTCSSSAVVSLSVNASPTLIATSNPTSICVGASSTATLTGSGALTYTWNPGLLTGSSVTVSPAATTIYTLSGTNAVLCQSSTTVSLLVIPIPTINVSASQTTICAGNASTLTATGATNYTWNPGSLSGGTIVVTPTSNTTYTVFGANASCTSSNVINIVVNSNPTVTASSSPTLICSGSSSTLTGLGALSYTWNPGNISGANATVTPVATTQYTVIGSNASGCTASAVANVSVNTTPTINPIATPTAICIGGSSTLTATGATTYTWNPGAITGSNISVSPIITTVYTVTGANGNCTDTKTVLLVVNPIPTVSAISNPTLICASTSATLTGAGAVSYTWLPGSLTGTGVVVNPTITTTYTVIGSSLSCTNTATVTINVNATPTVVANATPTTICSGTGGSSTLTASGAVSYTWNPGASTGSNVVVTPTSSTTYTVIGSSIDGCLGSQTVAVLITPTPTLNPISNPTAICAGGSATLSTTGATSYTWNPGASTGSSVVVSPTATTVYTVTGVNGICSSTATLSLIVNPNPTLTASSNPTAICSGGTATLTASGAVNYTWNPGSLTGSAVAVNPTVTTTYTVIGTNASGCNHTTTVSLIVNPTPTLIASGSPTNICSGSGGSTTLTASGAATYTWNPGSLSGSTVVVTPIVSTVYTVTGASAAGCTSTQTVSIIIITTPTVAMAVSPSTICIGGTVSLIGSGATNYTWYPGPITGSNVVITPTVTGNYTLVGANGSCTNSVIGLVTVIATPTIIPSASNSTICSGNSTTLTASGATSYTWNPGVLTGSNVVVTSTATTIYTVIGANAFGCTGSQTIQINVNPTPTITIVASATSICSGNTTTLTGFGANSYTWSPTASTNSVLNVSPPIGSTTFTLTGLIGNCSATNTIQIIVSPVPTITAVSNPTLKCGTSSATLSASGATTYTWNPGSLTGGTVVVNPATTTNYTVIGSNGSCTSSAFVTLSVAPTPTVNTFANPVNLCSGGSSTIGAFGAGVVSYTWNPGAIVSQTTLVTPTATTIYTVTFINAAGCTNTATRTIIVNPSPTVIPVANPSVICLGQSATLSATGANNYTWTPGPFSASLIVVTPTVSTTYTVRGNIGPCLNTQTLNITVNPNPTITASASGTLVCASNAVTLTSSGASSYTWQPGSLTGGTVVVNPLITTTYTVIGSNSSNCTQSSAVTVSISPGPTISILASNTNICSGNTVTLTPSGATNYTLYPGTVIGTSFVVTPTTSTTYTILGGNAVGCAGINTIQVDVSPVPNITITPSASGICIGETVSLTAIGANTYTWLPPISAVSPTIIDTPTITTTYTVVGSSTAGCNSTQTITITVTPIPTITASSSASVVCQSGTVTLTASGATNFTWMPGSLTGSNVIDSPTITTTYTVTGNSGGCSSTATLLVNVTPGPTGVTASSTGTITCLVTSVGLLGNTTSTNVSYSWTGPASFTSAVQNPTPVILPGTYTLTVTDLDSGCPLSSTTAVTGNTSIPNFTATTSGNLGCNATVTLSASSSNTSITYGWSGPSSFTSALQSETISVAGDYTVVASDALTGCSQTLVVSVLSNTDIPIISATIIPATCNGTVTNNDGTIILSGNGVKFDYVEGTTYTGTAVYVNATPIPTTGVITNTLVNPTTLAPYTIRVFGSNGCFKDTTLYLQPINCFNNVFGLTKAASTPTLINNKYNVTYTVTLINNGTADLTNVTLNENLSITFPFPSTYSVIVPPIVTSQGSSLSINAAFDGSTQISLTSPSASTLLASKRDTIVFTVQIDPKGFFGPFNNSVIGFANDVNSLVVTDSSNDGFIWDPDGDGFPTNNNDPTVINFTPNTRLGIAKAGVLSTQLSDKSYDITYIVTVKNFGNDTLKNVQVVDNLTLTVLSPAQFSIKNTPSATGTLLTGNAAFNGISNINLISGVNAFAPGDVDTIKFTINVTPDTVTVYKNTAFGTAINQFATIARDSSETGYNADSNGDGNPNEVSDSDPTIITINSSDFEIPEVFTPNDDGKNDYFVIKGLGSRKLKITVFNRWGNKVYENLEYDNKWNGYPNASGIIIGNNKLPQATYYYVAEFMDGDKEVKTGYVVIQY